MSSIIYSKMEGKNDPLFGHFEHPIKMFIEQESNNMEQQRGNVEKLYNVEKSNRYAETTLSETDFGPFLATPEGQRPENDSVEPGYAKTIYHIPYTNAFTITREMADDSQMGISSQISEKPKKFVRSYYKTRKQVAEQALIKATSASATINRATVDLTVGDGLALFHKAHTFKTHDGTQANYFVSSTAGMLGPTNIENTLGLLSNLMRNFETEDHENMGYVPNILILPANRFALETLCKKVVGSERTTGTNYNDINIQYGNWTLCVLDGWKSDKDEIMVMSSAANEELGANMFYNRVPLDIRSGIDDYTRNYYWTGYCRFGVGFTTWKHIIRFDDSGSNANAQSISLS